MLSGVCMCWYVCVMCVYVCVCVCICRYVSMRVYGGVMHVCVRWHVRMLVDMRVRICMCVWICVYV